MLQKFPSKFGITLNYIFKSSWS